METQPKYRFYATLLDAYTDYLNSDLIWDRYWGWSENPPHTPEEFRQQQFQSLIDRINRVPFDSEAADRGTAFNEVVDCLVENRKSDRIEVEKVYAPAVVGNRVENAVTALKVSYNNREFTFDITLCRTMAAKYKGALTQQFVSGILPTAYGDVELYGYVDELMPVSVHDIKTTGSYQVGKFRDHAQHLVYPFALRQMGNDVSRFDYDIVLLGKYGWETFTETYVFNPDRDIPLLRAKAEGLVEFIEENRGLITDKKIFNQLNDTAA